MKRDNFSKDKPNQTEPEIEIPSKDEVNGRRKPKKKNKDYEKKYGDDERFWN
jgi:hypothetical protein